MRIKPVIASFLVLFCQFAQADDPTAPSVPNVLPETPTSQSTTIQLVNCERHFPATIKTIDESIVSQWAEKAITQAFDFTPSNIDFELTKLKACFTDQGWESFNDALLKSGNLNAIKTQQLTVSSQPDGSLRVHTIRENQWKATVPLQVVYQNDKEKLTQLNSVSVLIGRKISGDLGIMQIIVAPRPTAAPAAPAETTQPENPVLPDYTVQENAPSQ